MHLERVLLVFEQLELQMVEPMLVVVQVPTIVEQELESMMMVELVVGKSMDS